MIHVAVLLRPYIDLIAAGRKTVECRLTKQARAPFDQIESGDRIYFKQSSGPYVLTAITDHVLFERDLTPKRVLELKRNYNDQICGHDDFWQLKRDAKFITLVWLRDVEPIKTGPGLQPLQGAAWAILPEPDARTSSADDDNEDATAEPPSPPPLSFSVEITKGNIRNRSLYVTDVIDHFPKWAFGGRNKRLAAKPITLMLRKGPTFQTDIVKDRNLFRSRKHWGPWYDTMNAKPGDHVVFTPLDEATYFVGFRPG